MSFFMTESIPITDSSRVGIVFVFQNRLIRLLSWRTPTQTLSFLAIYTFVCLDPHLLAAVPLAAILLSVMVPAFTSRHPPPPPQHTVSVTMPYYSTYAGPAIAPAPTIKPASETSKDFFRNMRDLQNSMADFSNVYDVMVSTITPATNFSNEVSSSALFLYLTVATCLLFISAHLLPWRLIFLLVGYGLTISMHPTAQTWLIKSRKHAQEQATLALSDAPIQEQKRIYSFPLPTTPAALRSTLASFSAITLSTTPETREVEIFELQHRPLSSSISSTNAAEWQPHVFTPSPYDPLSPSRIAGERPEGTRFFEDVQPPEGWEWASKKWELDLEAGEWVNDRLVVGVAYDVLHRDNNDQASSGTASTDSREGVSGEFGGWVWDLPPAPGGSGNRDEELWLAYGDYQVPSVGQRDDEKKKGKNKDKTKKEPAGRDWEEATRFGSSGRTGEWRRRRWVRLVKRRLMGGTTGEGGSGG